MALPNSREPRRITRTIPAAQLIGLLLAFVLTAGAGGVIAAGLVIPLASGVDTAVDTGVEVFEEVPAELVPGPLSEQSQIYASDGKTKLATFYAQNRIVVPLDRVADHMKNAVISIEDERFYNHGGVDPEGISRAAVKNFGGGATEGASTLTQQYVKNVLIEEADRSGDTFGVLEASEGSLTRKLREAKLAIALEKEMSKDEILQGYLNIAQFGRSVYGVETASRHYFNKSSSDLSVVEAATIAGITKSPNAFDPVENPEDATKRRDLVIGKMWQLGYITTEERDKAFDTKLADTLDVQPLDVGCDSAEGAAFFCDYVIKEVMSSRAFGKARSDRQDLLYRGGLKIITTLDIKKQRAAEKTVTEAVPADDSSGLESAITSVEPGTGKILAMAQNIPYDASSDPAPRHTAQNYSADYLHGNSRGFQPGSNYKPFVLTEWLRSGRTLNEMISATTVTLPQSSFSAGCEGASLAGTDWTVRNAETAASSSMSVLQGTFQSVNTVYARMSQQLNLCKIREAAYDVGFRPTQHASIDGGAPLERKATARDIEVLPSMVLGTQSTSPLGMASAYATFASGGTYCAPIAIIAVKDRTGEDIDVPEVQCEKTVETNVANTVAFAMTKVFNRDPWGTAWELGGLEDGRPVAGKTGTTNGAYQSWFTGYTPNLSTSVWVGESQGNFQHFDITVNGKFYKYLYGGEVAAPTWKTYMDQAVEDMPVKSFPAPDPKLVGQKATPPRSETNDSGSGDSDSGDSDGGDSDGDSGDEGGSEGGDSGGGNGNNGNGGGNGNGNGND